MKKLKLLFATKKGLLRVNDALVKQLTEALEKVEKQRERLNMLEEIERNSFFKKVDRSRLERAEEENGELREEIYSLLGENKELTEYKRKYLAFVKNQKMRI